jgi:hypothetical protein
MFFTGVLILDHTKMRTLKVKIQLQEYGNIFYSPNQSLLTSMHTLHIEVAQ